MRGYRGSTPDPAGELTALPIPNWSKGKGKEGRGRRKWGREGSEGVGINTQGRVKEGIGGKGKKDEEKEKGRRREEKGTGVATYSFSS